MLLKNIRYLDEHGKIQEDQYILVKEDRIVYLGAEEPLDYKGEVYEGKNKIVLPAYYNLHCHVPMTLIRGYGEGLPLDRWLQERMFPFEDLMTGEDMYWGSMLGIAEMLASGAASFNDMYMEMPSIVKAVEETGIKANISRGCTAFSDEVHFSQIKAWEETRFLQEYQKSHTHGRVIAECCIHGEYTSTETLVREVAQYAAEHNLGIHLHLSETQKEHEECKTRRGGRTPAQWFEHCGIFQAKTLAAHCVWVEEEDIAILAKYNVAVAHCPSSNLKLGSGIAPVGKMLSRGIRVGIGTDGAASNNNLNMHEEVNLASMLLKGANHDSQSYGPEFMLQMACGDAALIQGRPDCGTIKVGNKADMVIYDLDKPHMQPIFDVLSNILYAAGASDICMTMVDGKVLYQNGEHKTIDIEKVIFHANRIRDEKLKILQKN